MKIVVELTLELPVDIPDKIVYDPKFSTTAWLHGDSCLNSLLPPNEYFQCICHLVTSRTYRLSRVEDRPLFDENQLWESGACKPKEGIDC